MPLDLQTMLADGKFVVLILKVALLQKRLQLLISKGTDVLQIFEGFMDFLSWQTLNPSSTFDTIVLNSLALLPRIQEKLKGYKQVKSFLDNDEAGRKSFEVLKQFYPSVIDGSVRYRTHKDLNEWLVFQSKVQESQPSLPTTKRGIRR